MNWKLSIAAVALAASAALSLVKEGPEIGSPAPAISAPTWFNHVGRPLTLDNLGGNAVLIEFWATW